MDVDASSKSEGERDNFHPVIYLFSHYRAKDGKSSVASLDLSRNMKLFTSVRIHLLQLQS